jgi:hypothetical protein
LFTRHPDLEIFLLDCRQEAGNALENYILINKVVFTKQEDEDEKYSGEITDCSFHGSIVISVT